MGDNTSIAYCDATWNVTTGCSHESTGCANCFAERTASGRFLKDSPGYKGLTKDGRWTGDVRMHPDRLAWPLGKRRIRVIFVNDMSDLFHPKVPFEFIAAVYGVMACCSNKVNGHTFLICTKHVDRRAEFYKWIEHQDICGHTVGFLRAVGVETGCGSCFDPDIWPLDNVWEGFTAENQEMFEKRTKVALDTPAAHRWVSIEPQVGPIVTALSFKEEDAEVRVDTLTGEIWCENSDSPSGYDPRDERIEQVICGGESGPKARPFDLHWAKNLRDECKEAKTPFYFKQAGSNAYDKTVYVKGNFAGGIAHGFNHRSGANPSEWPEDLRVRNLAWSAPKEKS